MSGEANLIVDVEEYKACADSINSMCQGLDKAITSLVQHLETTSTDGLQSGQAAEHFLTFVGEIARLKGVMSESGTDIKSTMTDFLIEIDDADDLLFKNKGRKPFTDEEFRACFAVVENTAAPSLNSDQTYGWFSKLFDKIVKFIWKLADIEVTVGNDESILRKNVENLKEQTVEKISTIKTGVRTADRTYRQKLKNQLDVLKKYEQALTQIYNIVAAAGGTIDASGLITLASVLDQHELIARTPEVVTDEDVKYFADNVTDYFDSSTAIIGAICTTSLGQWVTSDFDVYRATVKSALDYFNSYSTHYVEAHTQYEKHKGEFDKMLELYNKYGSKWVDYYDGDKENAEMFNKLVKKTGEVSKDADDYVDIWFQLFCDMAESKEAFTRFKANCDLDDAEVRKALERVESLYNNEVDAYVFETLEHISQEVKNETVKKGAEAVAKAYAKIVPGGGMEQIMAKVTSSILDRAFAEAPAVAQHDWVLATQNSFDNAVANLKAADPGSEGYDVLVRTVREAFDSAKQARIKFFTTMAENSSGQEQRFYQLNLESVKTMSLDDVTRHRAVSPGEYYGENHSIWGYIFEGDIHPAT